MKQVLKQRQCLQEEKNLYFKKYSTNLYLQGKLVAFLKTLIEYYIMEMSSPVIVS